MKLLVNTHAKNDELELISFCKDNQIGLELQGFGFKGVHSIENWENQIVSLEKLLQIYRPKNLALHGPFVGLIYGHIDHILISAIEKRMEMTYNLVKKLMPKTVVLHTGYVDLVKKMGFEEMWLNNVSRYWKKEITRYADLGVDVVLENVAETEPDLMLKLCEEVNCPNFGLCVDVGHLNIISKIPPAKWIKQIKKYLKHVHVHDNNGLKDEHQLFGNGNINFEDIFKAVKTHAPDANITLEVHHDPKGKIENLIEIKNRYSF